MQAKTLRGKRWLFFSKLVLKHVEDYTVGRYGDYPNDRLYTLSAEDCKLGIAKYIARKDCEERYEGEHLQDLLKIAHYAAEACLKTREDMANETNGD